MAPYLDTSMQTSETVGYVDPEAPVVTESPTESLEQAQQPAEVTQPTGTEENAEQQEALLKEQKKQDVVQRRIDRLTWEKNEEKRRVEALETELRQYRQPSGQTEGTVSKSSPDDVQAEARKLVAQEKFNDACNKTFEAGKTEFPDFEKVLPRLALFGGLPPDLLGEITSMDAGHKVLKYLADNPDEGESLVNLPPLRQARELARIETAVAQAKPQSVSKAPPPINPVGGRSAPVEPEECATTADQIAWWKKHGTS